MDIHQVMDSMDLIESSTYCADSFAYIRMYDRNGNKGPQRILDILYDLNHLPDPPSTSAHVTAAEKRPSASFPSSFPVSGTGQACCGVRSSTPQADSPTRRRGKKSLLIRRDATLRISEALHLGIFEQPEK